MPKLCLCSIISRLIGWGFNLQMHNPECLGLTWHSWTDCTLLIQCRISWSCLGRVIFRGFLDTVILGFYERKRWCITGARKSCCVWVGESQGSVWRNSLSSRGLADSFPSHHAVNSCSYISTPQSCFFIPMWYCVPIPFHQQGVGETTYVFPNRQKWWILTDWDRFWSQLLSVNHVELGCFSVFVDFKLRWMCAESGLESLCFEGSIPSYSLNKFTHSQCSINISSCSKWKVWQ